jgi:hypothetical protein
MLNLLETVEEGVPGDPKFHWQKMPMSGRLDFAVIDRLGKPFFKKQVTFQLLPGEY